MLYRRMSDDEVYTIKEIYKKNKDLNKKMLSEYGSDFWKPYRDNAQYFDRRFMMFYSSFYPYLQEPEEGLESAADDFRYDVYSHLLANDKRYSELFRINVIEDNDAYSLTNNVDYQEIYSGSQTYDETFNKGEQQDSITYGEHQTSTEVDDTKGSHTDTTTHSTSAYNESLYNPVDQDETAYGQFKTDIDTDVTSKEHTDDTTSGAREDSIDRDITEEHTVHKVGNMGVQTVDDMLLKHWNNWNLFDFYKLVFSEIARDLLRGAD